MKCTAETLLPKSKKGQQSLLMFCSFNRRSVRGYLHTAAPIYELTTQEADFMYTEGDKNSVFALKNSVSNPLTTTLSDADKTFFVHSHAAKYALGAALMQKKDKGYMVSVQYGIRRLTKGELIYSTFEGEASAVVFLLNNFQHHLFGYSFIV